MAEENKRYTCPCVEECRIREILGNVSDNIFDNAPIIFGKTVPNMMLPYLPILRDLIEPTAEYFCAYSRAVKKAGRLGGECGLITRLNRGEKVEGVVEFIEGAA